MAKAKKIRDPQAILRTIYQRGTMPWEEATRTFHKTVLGQLLKQDFVLYDDNYFILTDKGRDEILTDLAVIVEEEDGTVNPLDHEYRMGLLGIRAMEIQAKVLQSEQEYKLADKGLDHDLRRSERQQANFMIETAAALAGAVINVTPALLGNIKKL